MKLKECLASLVLTWNKIIDLLTLTFRTHISVTLTAACAYRGSVLPGMCSRALWNVDQEWSLAMDGSWLEGQCCISAVMHTACLKHRKNQYVQLNVFPDFLSKILNNPEILLKSFCSVSGCISFWDGNFYLKDLAFWKICSIYIKIK